MRGFTTKNVVGNVKIHINCLVERVISLTVAQFQTILTKYVTIILRVVFYCVIMFVNYNAWIKYCNYKVIETQINEIVQSPNPRRHRF